MDNISNNQTDKQHTDKIKQQESEVPHFKQDKDKFKVNNQLAYSHLTTQMKHI